MAIENIWPDKPLRLSLWETRCLQRGSRRSAGWSHGTHPRELHKADAPGVTSGEALLDVAVVQVVLCRAQVKAQQQALLELRLLLCVRLCPCMGRPALRSGRCSTLAGSAPSTTQTLLHAFRSPAAALCSAGIFLCLGGVHALEQSFIIGQSLLW